MIKTDMWSSNYISSYIHSLKAIHIHQSLEQHYVQKPKHGNDPGVCVWTNQWVNKMWNANNIIQPYKGNLDVLPQR